MMAGKIIMPPSSHLLKTSCRHLYIYSKQVDVEMACQKIMPPSSLLLKTSCRHLYIYSKHVDVEMAGQKRKRRKRFLIHEIGRIDGGRGF
jgi:hypothetical protein